MTMDTDVPLVDLLLNCPPHREAGARLHFAFSGGEDRMVPSHTNIGTGVELGTPLAHENIAGDNDLAAELLDAEPPAFAVATVAGAAACFLVCHGTVLLT